MTQWAHDLVNRSHTKSVQELSSIRNGWHFNALHTSVHQINDFRIEDMAQDIKLSAPHLWNTIYTLLSTELKPLQHQHSQDSVDETIWAEDDKYEAEFWKSIGDEDVPGDTPDPEGNDTEAPPHPWC
jgi:hypothetical protein